MLTRALIQAVKRNSERFPADFMFQLTRDEFESLRSQSVISKRGGRRHLPYAFTEHGALMAANILNSKRAIQASVQVVRAFIKLREMLTSNADLARKLSELERKYDSQFRVVFDAIRQLMTPPLMPRKQIGFTKATKKCIAERQKRTTKQDKAAIERRPELFVDSYSRCALSAGGTPAIR